MTPGLSFCTFNETHPKLPRKEPLIIGQTHVHAALDGLNVLSMRCVCACKTKQLVSLFSFLACKRGVKKQTY